MRHTPAMQPGWEWKEQKLAAVHNLFCLMIIIPLSYLLSTNLLPPPLTAVCVVDFKRPVERRPTGALATTMTTMTWALLRQVFWCWYWYRCWCWCFACAGPVAIGAAVVDNPALAIVVMAVCADDVTVPFGAVIPAIVAVAAAVIFVGVIVGQIIFGVMLLS